jgi:hypothetical protein
VCFGFVVSLCVDVLDSKVFIAICVNLNPVTWLRFKVVYIPMKL